VTAVPIVKEAEDGEHRKGPSSELEELEPEATIGSLTLEEL